MQRNEDKAHGFADDEWRNDFYDVFHEELREIWRAGDSVRYISDVWCDARGRDDGYIRSCFATGDREPASLSRWYVVADEAPAADSPLVEFIRASYPEREVSWVVEHANSDVGAYSNCGPVSGTDALSPPEPVRAWYAPLENARYVSYVCHVGYSHDGSEDYYSIRTNRAELADGSVASA